MLRQFIDGEAVIHIKTRTEFLEFVKLINRLNKTQAVYHYIENACFRYEAGYLYYAKLDYYKKYNPKVIEFSDINWFQEFTQGNVILNVPQQYWDYLIDFLKTKGYSRYFNSSYKYVFINHSGKLDAKTQLIPFMYKNYVVVNYNPNLFSTADRFKQTEIEYIDKGDTVVITKIKNALTKDEIPVKIKEAYLSGLSYYRENNIIFITDNEIEHTLTVGQELHKTSFTDLIYLMKTAGRRFHNLLQGEQKVIKI